MTIWIQEINLKTLNEQGKNTFSDYLKIVFSKVEKDTLYATLTIESFHLQPWGIMHGGVSCSFAETVASAAANFCVEKNKVCVGLSIYTNHMRPVRQKQTLRAKAFPLHLGKSTHVWEIEVRNTREKLVSASRLTLAILEKK